MKKRVVVIIVLVAVIASALISFVVLGKQKHTHTHVFDKEVASKEYFYSAATCTEKAKYYFSCKCGAKGTDTFDYGTFKHSFTNYVSDNNATCQSNGTKTAHCDREGCDAIDVITVSGTKLAHTYDVKRATDEYLEGHATCTKRGVYRYSCACGEKGYSDQTFEYGKAAGHKMVNGKCSVCGAVYSSGLKYKLDGEGYSVAGIGDCADTDIIIPEIYNGLPITSIGAYAFDNCKEIISVTIPYGVTVIGRNAFEDCVKLDYVKIPDSVTKIESHVFAFCNKLRTIEMSNGLKEIGSSAFQDCFNLQDLTIPDGLTSIGDEAFIGCKSIEYNKYDTGLYLGNENNPYYALIKTESKEITSCIVNSQCKMIYYAAFSGCLNLTNVVLPDGLISIGSQVFFNCVMLKNLKIPKSVTYIGFSAFSNANITDIVIPYGITEIKHNAFSRCENLTSIEIPVTVTSFGNYAFYYCTKLTSITFKGTKSQWYAIVKEGDWRLYVPTNCTVHCSDGDTRA